MVEKVVEKRISPESRKMARDILDWNPFVRNRLAGQNDPEMAMLDLVAKDICDPKSPITKKLVEMSALSDFIGFLPGGEKRLNEIQAEWVEPPLPILRSKRETADWLKSTLKMMDSRLEQVRRLRKELDNDLSHKAYRLRRAMTIPVNDVDDLIDDGFIEMSDKDGNRITRDDLVNDGDAPASWIISLEAVLLLHLYESKWFHRWQAERYNKRVANDG